MTLVLAATKWRTNAEMIAACAELGYLKDTDLVLDPTYGKGNWWKKWQPTQPVQSQFADGFDFCYINEQSDKYDVVAFDPPYVSVGGRKTSGIKEMHRSYGMDKAAKSPRLLQEETINPGLRECARVLRPKGYLLVKCQDYISSGKFWAGTHYTLCHALSLNLELVDRLEMITTPRPQPDRVRQVHARRNLSTLFVLRKKAA